MVLAQIKEAFSLVQKAVGLGGQGSRPNKISIIIYITEDYRIITCAPLMLSGAMPVCFRMRHMLLLGLL